MIAFGFYYFVGFLYAFISQILMILPIANDMGHICAMDKKVPWELDLDTLMDRFEKLNNEDEDDKN